VNEANRYFHALHAFHAFHAFLGSSMFLQRGEAFWGGILCVLDEGRCFVDDAREAQIANQAAQASGTLCA
jgi:hypothetical protein